MKLENFSMSMNLWIVLALSYSPINEGMRMENKFIHKLLVLGGRPIGSLDIVRYAQSKGVYVIVCDYLPVNKSPAKKIADEVWDYSTADVDLIIKKAQRSGVTAVFTGAHEFNIVKAIEICEKIKLPFYCSSEQWYLCSNKIRFKNMCSRYDISTPFTYAFNGSDHKLDQTLFSYPVIVKPSDSSSNIGITICYKYDELSFAIEHALKNSIEKKCLIEDFITGDEVSIFFVIKNGIPYFTSICKRFTNNTYGKDVPLPIFYYFNKKYLSQDLNNLILKLNDLFNAFQLSNGLVEIQAIFSENVYFVFEMALRISGIQEYYITSYLLGFNPLQMLVDYSLNGEFGLQPIVDLVDPYFDGANVCIVPIVLNVGKIVSVEGLDLIKKHRNVFFVSSINGEKEEVTQEMFGSLNQVYMRIYVAAHSKEEMVSTVNFINRSISVKDECGKDMILYRFDTDQLI